VLRTAQHFLQGDPVQFAVALLRASSSSEIVSYSSIPAAGSTGMLYVLYTSLSNLKLNVMLRWTVIFLIVAIIAAIFGFGGVAAGAAGIAKVLFFNFLVLFVLSLISGRRTTDV
jgi:uncharacterized membrane protein YtjA (UPF0391 family)